MIEWIESTWKKVAAVVMSVYVAVQTGQEALPQLQAALPAGIYEPLAAAVSAGALWLTGILAVGGVLRGAWVSWKAKRAAGQGS